MPPTCGDGVKDAADACEPPASGTFCIKNAQGQCVFNRCGDGDVCNKTATDASTGLPHPCNTAGNGNEQCDDGNTLPPSSDPSSPQYTDTCWDDCTKAFCGDGVTSPNEQCDPAADVSQMGCSNMDEAQDAAQQQVAPQLECCYDGEVVDGSKVGVKPGLIDAEHALVALNKCKVPNAVGNLACDARLQKKMSRIANRVRAAELYTEQDDLSRATKIMRSVTTQIDKLMSSRRMAKVTGAGGACNSARMIIANELSDIRDMAYGVSGHLNDNIGGQ
jgi:hypothetical protein